MTFEFHGADLETPEGINTFKSVYVAVADSDSVMLFEEDDYEQWATDSPDQAEVFLRNLASDQSPHIRNLAGRLARTDWVKPAPDLAVEVMLSVMMDEDPIARGTLPQFVEEAVQEETFDEWLQNLGLPRIHQLLTAAKKAKETYSTE